MDFPVSGVQAPFWVPPAVAFAVAAVTAPAGISGAFLLLPFQMSVLGFVSPAVTPTNLIYNIAATPGGVYRYIREGRMDWPLAWAIAAGSAPGVLAGAAIRIRWLPDPRYAKLFVALVLLYLGTRLILDSAPGRSAGCKRPGLRPFQMAMLALPVGVIGGIYGVGGGAIIAPFAMTVGGLTARRVAGAAMFGTFVTSLAGAASFELLQRTRWAAGQATAPDWTLGLLFGAGGLFGAYCGARLQKRIPERLIRLVLALLVTGIAIVYVAQFTG